MATPRTDRPSTGTTPPSARPPVLRSYDRGKWTRIPKARRTIAEITEIIKRVVERTYFPLLRAYHLYTNSIEAQSMSSEFLLIPAVGTIWLENEYDQDTYIHGDSTWSDPEDTPGNQVGAAYVGGWDVGTDTQRNGVVWCDDGPMIYKNSLRLPIVSNVAKIVTFDTDTSGNEQYILKATLNSALDIDLEFSNGGELVKVGRANDEGAQVYRPTVSIPNATVTIISFNNESWDTDDIHDNATNPSRLTCKTPGRYLITANVRFAANATGYRTARIQRTDVSIPATLPVASKTRNPVSGIGTDIDLHQIVWMSLNDYVVLEVYQTSGAALNVLQSNWDTPVFTMHRIDG